jgi:hypothetical protein
MNYTTEFKSIRGQVSAEEWQARVDLAACYRLVDKYGMTDLIYNHITARIPGSPDRLEPGQDRCRGRDRLEARDRLRHQQIGLRDPRCHP